MVVIVVKADEWCEAEEARTILAVHRAESETGGLCAGCIGFAGRAAWWPCPQAEWARGVLADESSGGTQS
jgi:hypothetical protein